MAPSTRQRAIDVGAALVVFAFSVGLLAGGRDRDADAHAVDGTGVLLAAVASLPLVFRRQAPLGVVERMARQPAPDASSSALVAELTQREREVLELVARGLTNVEIAEALVVEPSTVKTHVGHILRKLRLRDRIQAVIFADESDLVKPGPKPEV